MISDEILLVFGTRYFPLTGVIICYLAGAFFLLNLSKNQSSQAIEVNSQRKIAFSELGFISFVVFSLFYFDEDFSRRMDVQNSSLFISIDAFSFPCSLLGSGNLIMFFLVMGFYMEFASISLLVVSEKYKASRSDLHKKIPYVFFGIGCLVSLVYLLMNLFHKSVIGGYDVIGTCGIERGHLLSLIYSFPPLIVYPFTIFCIVHVKRISDVHTKLFRRMKKKNIYDSEVIERPSNGQVSPRDFFNQRTFSIGNMRNKERYSFWVYIGLLVNLVMWVPYTSLQIFLVLVPGFEKYPLTVLDPYADTSEKLIFIKILVLNLLVYGLASSLVLRCLNPKFRSAVRALFFKIGLHEVVFKSRRVTVERTAQSKTIDEFIISPSGRSSPMKSQNLKEIMSLSVRLHFGLLQSSFSQNESIENRIIDNLVCYSCLSQFAKELPCKEDWVITKNVLSDKGNSPRGGREDYSPRLPSNLANRFTPRVISGASLATNMTNKSSKDNNVAGNGYLSLEVVNFPFDLSKCFSVARSSRNFNDFLTLELQTKEKSEIAAKAFQEKGVMDLGDLVQESFKKLYAEGNQQEISFVVFSPSIFYGISTRMIGISPVEGLEIFLEGFFDSFSQPADRYERTNSVMGIFSRVNEFYMMMIKTEIKKMVYEKIIPEYTNHFKTNPKTLLQPLLGLYSTQVCPSRGVSTLFLQKPGVSKSDFIFIFYPNETIKLKKHRGSFIKDKNQKKSFAPSAKPQNDPDDENSSLYKISGKHRSFVIQQLIQDLSFLQNLGLTRYFVAAVYVEKGQEVDSVRNQNVFENRASSHWVHLTIMDFVQDGLLDIAKSDYFSSENPDFYKEQLFGKICTRLF